MSETRTIEMPENVAKALWTLQEHCHCNHCEECCFKEMPDQFCNVFTEAAIKVTYTLELPEEKNNTDIKF